jgi:hypothetical protein
MHKKYFKTKKENGLTIYKGHVTINVKIYKTNQKQVVQGNQAKNPQTYFCTSRTFLVKINVVIRSFSFVLKERR